MNTYPFLIMGIPALIALTGGILAAFWTPSHSTRSLIQHFAAGVVLMEDNESQSRRWCCLAGF